jgi:hypothetical protein|tara:strand:+ start:1948 stop:2196 length:249 start_codon:yes stop_codon:yes gene_type:complete
MSDSTNQDSYVIAIKEANKLIDQLIDDDLDAGAAYTGLLVGVIYRLILGSPDKQDVTGIIGNAMASASAHVEMQEHILSDIH